MRQKPVSCGGSGSEVCYQLHPISAKYPWLVAHGTEDQTFYTINDQLCRYRCQLPKLTSRTIRGRERYWRMLCLGPDPYPICFPTFYSQEFYALCKEEELYVLKNYAEEYYLWKQVVAARTSSN
ncbi:hypothetical protein Tco_1235391 [Tanacetum coccineum]